MYIFDKKIEKMSHKTLILTIFISLWFAAIKAQIPNYVPTAGLLAWYPFDNNSNDLSGNNNNAVNNNVTFIDDRNGIPNAAGSFNGSNTWFEVTAPSFTFASTDSFTYSFWVNKDVQPLAGIVMMIGSPVSGNFISLIQGASLMQFGTNKQQSAWIWTSCAHTLNVWDHYVATYNAGIMNLYKNGVFQSTNTFTYTNVLSANLPLYIGKGINGGNFNGAIDDIGIWGRALSDQEITDLYNSIVTKNAEHHAAQKFQLFPSISNQFINISNNLSNVVPTNYSIYDVNGKCLLQGMITNNNYKIDISNISKGIYFVNLGDENFTKFKFIKE
jgi:hypothetical protein